MPRVDAAGVLVAARALVFGLLLFIMYLLLDDNNTAGLDPQ